MACVNQFRPYIESSKKDNDNKTKDTKTMSEDNKISFDDIFVVLFMLKLLLKIKYLNDFL